MSKFTNCTASQGARSMSFHDMTKSHFIFIFLCKVYFSTNVLGARFICDLFYNNMYKQGSNALFKLLGQQYVYH